MSSNINSLLPMNITNLPWLYENDNFYNKELELYNKKLELDLELYNKDLELYNKDLELYNKDLELYNKDLESYKEQNKCFGICNYKDCKYKSKYSYFCAKHTKFTPIAPIVIDYPILKISTCNCNCGCNIKHNIISNFRNNSGKWMLFYNKQSMNENWILAKKLYRENKLDGVVSMKCSTLYKNIRASPDDHVIILYCNNSNDEEIIMNIGKKILVLFNYIESQTIYYKTDEQTMEGTIATGCIKNHTYKLLNPLYKRKCLIQIDI
jgi:hypothetical protein